MAHPEVEFALRAAVDACLYDKPAEVREINLVAAKALYAVRLAALSAKQP
jgi:hypothetical protein